MSNHESFVLNFSIMRLNPLDLFEVKRLKFYIYKSYGWKDIGTWVAKHRCEQWQLSTKFSCLVNPRVSTSPITITIMLLVLIATWLISEIFCFHTKFHENLPYRLWSQPTTFKLGKSLENFSHAIIVVNWDFEGHLWSLWNENVINSLLLQNGSGESFVLGSPSLTPIATYFSTPLSLSPDFAWDFKDLREEDGVEVNSHVRRGYKSITVNENGIKNFSRKHWIDESSCSYQLHSLILIVREKEIHTCYLIGKVVESLGNIDNSRAYLVWRT